MRGIVRIAKNRDENHVILLNENKSFVEQNYHGFHELTHILTVDEPGTTLNCFGNTRPNQNSYIEWLANEGAAEFLMPYKEILPIIRKVIEDGIIEQSELDYLLEFFKAQINPLNAEIGAIDVELSNKSICLTGDFDYGSKQEVQERLSEIGATVVSSVTRKTDILLIGEKGSESWACGTYGTKAKKAIELRSKGYPIMILKEKDVQL